ncbi:MAG: hypothetical protein LBM20_05635 [Rikenellaceae bacterium]|jgi:hypothetical protein|nr:hypothetical protein [Rikenellaceae bacterium]
MERKTNHQADSFESSNPYSIYPDIDQPISVGRSGQVTDEELTQEVDQINPDPDSLDRG